MKLDQMIKTPAGRRWAYLGVFLGFGASITANVASTVLRETTVSLFLRVPFAVFWPLATYVAIEVIVRTVWNDSLSHRAVRVVLIVPVAGVAAFVSYLHQHHLMVLANEPGLAQGFGPLAVDGMLFGMTATLIVTKLSSLPEEKESLSTPTVDALLSSWGIEETPQIEEKETPTVEMVSPVSAIPSPPKTRARWDARLVAEMLLDGEKNTTIAEKTGAGNSTISRYRRVTRLLQENPRQEISLQEKVPAEHVQMIRELVSK